MLIIPEKMSALDQRIAEFIESHTVLTLATSFGDEPYCANLFYDFLPEEGCLIITSDKNTKHIRNISHNIFVAGSIVESCSQADEYKGIQFQGVISEPGSDLAQRARQHYWAKLPFTIGMNTTLWVIDLTLIKYSDSSMGFGKKLTWKK